MKRLEYMGIGWNRSEWTGQDREAANRKPRHLWEISLSLSSLSTLTHRTHIHSHLANSTNIFYFLSIIQYIRIAGRNPGTRRHSSPPPTQTAFCFFFFFLSEFLGVSGVGGIGGIEGNVVEHCSYDGLGWGWVLFFLGDG